MENILCGCLILVLLALQQNLAVAQNACECYIFGTEQSAAGFTIYDNKTCDCKCKAHVIGKRCDKCEPGFNNIKSGHGCEPCLCDSNGSQNQNCNATTGECRCKKGFFGYRCNQCKPQHYRKSQTKCEPCNCNIHGSTDLQCDETGQCPCHSNVQGIHCDSCRKFTYKLTAQCIDCPECYQVVNRTLIELRKNLAKVEDLIENIVPNPYDNDDFIDKIEEIHEDSLSVRKGLESFKNPDPIRLKGLRKKVTNMNNEIKTLLLKLQSTSDLENKIQGKLNKSEQELKQLPNLIKVAEISLKNVSSTNQNIIQNNDILDGLVKEGNQLQRNLSSKVEELLKEKRQSKDTCEAACRTSDEFDRAHSDFQHRVSGLKDSLKQKEIEKIREKIKHVENRTKSCLIEDEENKKKLKDLNLPKLDNVTDPDLHQKNNDKIGELTEEVKAFNDYITDVSEHYKNVDGKQISLQKEIDNSLTELKKLDRQSDDSLQQIHDLIDKYANISGYNTTLQGSKNDMVLKLQDIPKIQEKIDELIEKMGDNDEGLEHSRKELNKTKEIINNAFKDIKKLQNGIDAVLVKINVTEKNVTKLLDNIAKDNINASNLNSTIEDIINLRKQAGEDGRYLQEAAKNLTEIKASILSEYENAIKIIKENIQKMTDITEYLNILPTSDEEFDLIDEELTLAEDVLRLKEEIRVLSEEVDSIRKIKDSLPTGEYCPKEIHLEAKTNS